MESNFDGKKYSHYYFISLSSTILVQYPGIFSVTKINCLSMKIKSWLFNLNSRENKIQNKDQIWKYVNLHFTIYTAIHFTNEKHQRFEGGKWYCHTNIQLNKYPQNIWMNLNNLAWIIVCLSNYSHLSNTREVTLLKLGTYLKSSGIKQISRFK